MSFVSITHDWDRSRSYPPFHGYAGPPHYAEHTCDLDPSGDTERARYHWRCAGEPETCSAVSWDWDGEQEVTMGDFLLPDFFSWVLCCANGDHHIFAPHEAALMSRFGCCKTGEVTL